MAKSKFEYVREFESHDRCLPNCFIVVRVDGKGFHKFTEAHGFDKPNDRSGLWLMSKAAACVIEEFNDICCAYGQSDEYSFIFSRNTNIYNRRADKIASVVCSLFTSSYGFYWDKFCCKKLKYPPAFDSRVILYPTVRNLRDYLSWRQADAHINNLYNTAFWGLVQKCGHSKQEAEKILRGTVSSEKHELLFKDCKINYNNECELYKKGTIIIKSLVPSSTGSPVCNTVYVPLNCDIINDKFWNENPHILDSSVDMPVCQEIGANSCEIVFVKFRNVAQENLKGNNKKKSKNPQRKEHHGEGDNDPKCNDE
ncbi:hypothetical protein M8J77_018061 [Diaphorina citri]|nr:hypothetical protein M8J77_018061 [Diaphorina citri]